MAERFDIVVVGAGIAGASAAAEMAGVARVILLEREARPGVHSTGRSAALFHLTYGGPTIQPLSRASLALFRRPPDGFRATSLLTPRGVLIVAGPGEEALLEAQRCEAPDAVASVGRDEALARFPALRPDAVAGALYDDTASDIDVDGLHQAYLRLLRTRGGELVCDAEVQAIERAGGRWRVHAGEREIEAEVVVNAAGAWGDRLAALAGVAPLGLEPKRRSAALIDAPGDVSAWPMLIDAAERFYVKPDAGRLLVSPAEETDVEPHDACADDIALAEGIARMQAMTTLEVTRKPHAWAGLRTFTPDRAPAIGFDPAAPGFFWLVGQGGFGVQTAPAVAKLAAGLVAGASLADALAGVNPTLYRPERFRA